jgi:hypothetical protein
MAAKGLKPAMARPSARDALAAIDTIAQQSGLPPATMSQAARQDTPEPKEEKLVQVNIRVRRSLGDQLADRARAEQTSQKVIICRALAAVGFEVHQEDLRPIPPPRRRGSRDSS